MDLFKKFRRKRINQILENVDKKDVFKRYVMLTIGCFVIAFAFNVFFKQFGIVCFGITGLSLVVNKKTGLDPSIFILCSNIILLIFCYFTLGKKKMRNSFVGSLLLPCFVYLTKFIVPYVKFDNVELLVVAVFGGVLSGLGYGIIYKSNFNTGGTDIITETISKYTKISLGKATWLSDGLVVLSGLLAFSWEIVLYGFMVLYIISFMTDKVVLGISQSKAFYIVTSKEAEVREFLLSITDGGVTIIDAKGGYSNDEQSLLLGVVPTRQYFIVKEGLREIDDNIFFLACDSYEVSSRRK